MEAGFTTDSVTELTWSSSVDLRSNVDAGGRGWQAPGLSPPVGTARSVLVAALWPVALTGRFGRIRRLAASVVLLPRTATQFWRGERRCLTALM
jgi:hypothetical protein